MILLFEPHGEVLPSLRQRDVGIRKLPTTAQEICIRDRASGMDHWHAELPELPRSEPEPLQDIGRPIYSYQSLGTLVFLPLRTHVVAVDSVRRRMVWKKDLLVGDGAPPPKDPDQQDPWLGLHYGDGWVQQLGQPLVLSPSVLCLRARKGLLGVDPLTGQTLWKRTDVPVDAVLFGEGDTVCLAERHESRIKSIQVFRASDGSRLAANGASAIAGATPLRAMGSRLLALHTSKKGKVTLRLHEVPAGKDVWQQTFAPQTKVCSTTEEFVAAFTTQGELSVLASATGKEVLRRQLEIYKPESILRISLLADGQHFYLACHRADPALDERSSLQAGSGLYSLPIRGELYACKHTGEGLAWRKPLRGQRLILNHFSEMPVLLLTSWTQPDKSSYIRYSHFTAIDRHAGRTVAEKETEEFESLAHTLLLDPKEGKIVFLAD
jgi:hypothetical protein